ncbi:MAG: InlB B-repeat-containing protein, partial [Muribaculaceae bacterium]|nr:InlB B-repeat-containing protein [Muribaculaceae bacterium]
AEDITVEGSYTANVYKAIFKIGDETIDTIEVTYGDAIKAPEAPEKEGYTFDGWKDLPETMPAQDITVEGSYTANVYKAIFKIGDETIETLEIPYGDAIKAPEAPEKEGYTFDGWKDLPETMPAQDITVEGSYTANVYKAIFKIGDETIETLEIPYGDAIKAPEAPEKEGYTFDGWKDLPETMPAQDITVEGSYTVNVYKAVFMLDGVEFVVLDVPFGAVIEIPEVPAKEGYSFAGWSEIPASMPAHDVEIKGAYTVNSYKAVFTVDGKVVASFDVPYGSDIVAPEVEEKEGYSFDWADLPETMPAHDIEVKGAYEVNTYRLVVYLDDEVYMDEELPYGAEVVIPEPEVEYGFKFDGWQEEVPATMPAHDVEIHGTVSEDGQSGIFGVSAGENVTVYTIDGVLIYKDKKVSDIKEHLTPGIYIINGKKMVIR